MKEQREDLSSSLPLGAGVPARASTGLGCVCLRAP
ncbi:UNVERIFIED_ORG: hypothetical protein HNP28_003235 [Comamonas terrigena]|jgi:hypothetical protein